MTYYERLVSDVATRDRSLGCWTDGPWSCDTSGYGHLFVRLEGRLVLGKAHRLAAELSGLDIRGVHVLHRCDTPPCYNPACLFLGTNADNVADKMRKGRYAYGEALNKGGLTEADVMEIRGLLAEGRMTRRAIGRFFGIDHGCIDDIANGIAWKECK